MMNDDEINPTERRCRRVEWTCGSIVQLADGSTWYLPRIDLVFLLNNPGFQEDLQRAHAIDKVIQSDVAVTSGLTLAQTFYQSHMANVAVRLLQANYERTDAEWRALITFDRMEDMLALTLIATLIVFQASHLMLVLIPESGRDRLTVFSSN